MKKCETIGNYYKVKIGKVYKVIVHQKYIDLTYTFLTDDGGQLPIQFSKLNNSFIMFVKETHEELFFLFQNNTIPCRKLGAFLAGTYTTLYEMELT